MRLIDVDALQDAIRKSAPVIPEMSRFYTRDRVDFEIAIAPEIDAVPVKHGKWKETSRFDIGFWFCSNCDFVSEALAAPKLYYYCPNCGAKMDGEDNE